MRRVLLALIPLAVLGPAGSSRAEPAPDSTAKWDHAASAENVVVGRVVETHTTHREPRSCIIDPREYCHVEILEVLQGSMKAGKVVRGWFTPTLNFGRRNARAVGKLALLFPEPDGFNTIMRTDDGLPAGGVLLLRDRTDPALERMRLAIRQASLDSLIARADAVCLGGYRYGQSTEFVVRRWIAGEHPGNLLWLEHAAGEPSQGGKVLMFLERDAQGRLRPVGNGRGELAVRHGRVVRYDRKLDDVLREICDRRPYSTFVASAQ